MTQFLLFCLLCVAALLGRPVAAQDADGPRNLIIMIADGFGPASATLAREVKGEALVLDSVLQGAVGTRSTSSRVTDSAAAATAFASGIKTYNGAIGVDTLRRPVGTLFEAAEARGMATGLVATSRITHATPASFVAHVAARAEEATIAEQMMASGVDVVFGGGYRFFVADTLSGSRTDGRDLLSESTALTFTDPAAFDTVATVPVFGLFARDHLDYEIDRTDQPSLAAMTQKALDLIGEAEQGFVLMVEGSRIDHAAHANDPVGHLHDIYAYDEAVRVALDFARADGRTLVVSTSDHETGGMTLGRDGVYAWNADYLARVRASAERMGRLIAAGQNPAEVLRASAVADSLTAEEQAALGLSVEPVNRRISNIMLGKVVSRRAGIGWTGGGHTAVDVGLYAWGPGADRLCGVMENDALGRALADLLGLDVAAVTARLRAGDSGSAP